MCNTHEVTYHVHDAEDSSLDIMGIQHNGEDVIITLNEPSPTDEQKEMLKLLEDDFAITSVDVLKEALQEQPIRQEDILNQLANADQAFKQQIAELLYQPVHITLVAK